MEDQGNNQSIREKLKREAEKILNLSVDHSGEVIAIFDTELNYILANDAACKLLSKENSEIEGNNLLQLFPQLTASASHRHLLTALSGKTLLDVASEGNITRAGAKFLSCYYPLKENGNVYAVLAVTKKIYFP